MAKDPTDNRPNPIQFSDEDKELGDDPRFAGLRRQVYTEAQRLVGSEIDKMAAASRIKLTPQQRQEIIDSFTPTIKTDVRSARSQQDIARDLSPLVQASVNDIAGTQKQQDVLNQIERQTNPGKFLSPEQIAQNNATAQRLAQQYGQDDPDLIGFLSEQLANGDSPFEISQFLQTTPQYLKKQAEIENERVKGESAQAREALDADLLKSEEETFQRAAPQIISSYMRAGRLDSSGLQNALARARTELARERQGFLSNAAYNDSIRAQGYRREDFVNNNAQAFGSYLRQNEPSYQQRFKLQDAGNAVRFQQPFNQLNRAFGIQDQTRQRQYELEDYDRSQSDYSRYLSDARKSARQNVIPSLLGNLIGAGAQGWAMGGFKGL